jgi:hypothetical protein
MHLSPKIPVSIAGTILNGVYLLSLGILGFGAIEAVGAMEVGGFEGIASDVGAGLALRSTFLHVVPSRIYPTGHDW